MITDVHGNGMYLSRSYLEWLMRMRDETTMGCETFGDVVRMFSNSQYKRFIEELNHECNDYYYHLTCHGDSVSLSRNYEAVYVPYGHVFEQDGDLSDVKASKDFVVYGSGFCENGNPPRSGKLLYRHSPYSSGWFCILVYWLGFKEKWEEYKDYNDGNYKIKLNFLDIAGAEENSKIIGNYFLSEELFMIAELNVIRHLMDEIEEKNLISKKEKFYGLKLLALAEAIISLSAEKYQVGQKIPVKEILKLAEKRVKLIIREKGTGAAAEIGGAIQKSRKQSISFEVADRIVYEPVERDFGEFEPEDFDDEYFDECVDD